MKKILTLLLICTISESYAYTYNYRPSYSPRYSSQFKNKDMRLINKITINNPDNLLLSRYNITGLMSDIVCNFFSHYKGSKSFTTGEVIKWRVIKQKELVINIRKNADLHKEQPT